MALEAQNQYFSALKNLRKCDGLKPAFDDVREHIAAVRTAGSAAYLAEAEAFQETQLPGAVIIACNRGLEFESSQELKKLIQITQKAIQKECQIRVAWAGFSSPLASAAGVASQLESRLLRHVMKSSMHKKGRLQVVDRERIKKVFTELQMANTDLVDESTLPALGKLRAADLFLFGKLLNYEEDEQELSRESRTTEYVDRYETRVHTVYVPNFATGGTTAMSVPQQVAINDICYYEVVDWESYVTLELSVRLVDVSTGQILAEVADHTERENDTCVEVSVSAGSASKAGVTPQAKKLKPPSVMKRPLIDKSALNIYDRLKQYLDVVSVYKSRLKWHEDQRNTDMVIDAAGRLTIADAANAVGYRRRAAKVYPRN